MDQYIVCKHKEVSNRSVRILVDKETGEELEVEEILKVYDDRLDIRNAYIFDFLNVLGVADSKKLEVFLYVIENTDNDTQLFVGTFKKISEKSGASLSTVKRVMKRLLENQVIIKVQNGVYKVHISFLDVSKPGKYMLINYKNNEVLLGVSEANE